ncbi:VOC family protein [Aliarcobacter butzleri]|uniref:VOC family protein n=1 Tax=Aliarcobacter butzleri TaxID=28197 RepID=UPI002B256429|nr:VOC family protein [Aliarcobacter butzleri]
MRINQTVYIVHIRLFVTESSIINILNLDHLVLTVKDIEETVKFYEKLGMCIRRNNSDSQPIYIRTLCRS